MAIKYNIKSGITNIKCMEFDNIIDLYESIVPSIQCNKFGILDEIKENQGWNGTYSLDETVEGMRFGFQKSTDYFLDNIKEIRSQETTGKGTYLDYEGFAYDMGSVVEGIPECCLNAELPAIKPCIKIMVDIAFDAWCGPDKLNNRGIAIANLINTLIINGFIIDLYFMRYNHQNDMDIMFTVKVNTEVLPISTIAFMSSADFFRKIGFMTTDLVRNKKSEAGRGYSIMQPFILNKIKKEDIFFIGGSFLNPEISSHLDSIKSANEYIISLFNIYCEEHKIKISFNDEEKQMKGIKTNEN